MDEEQVQVEEARVSEKRNIPHVVFVVAVLVVLFFIFIFMSDKIGIKSEPFTDLKGKVYLSLAEKNRWDVDTFYYDFNTQELDRLFKDREFIRVTPKFSNDGKKIAFVGIRRSTGGGMPLSLFTHDITTNENKEVFYSETEKKRLPQWSPDNKTILISAVTPENLHKDQSLPETWIIGAVSFSDNRDTSEIKGPIANGIYQFWSPDGKSMLFLKDDGLYTYNFDTKEEVLALESMFYVSTFMKINVSDDGTHLAWSRPEVKDVVVYKILSWNPFDAELVGAFSGLYQWPVFSDDNKYIVVQEVLDSSKNEHRLIAVRVGTWEKKELSNLSEYNYFASFVTDWGE